ncbi:L-rhamnose mutarotase [Williamsia limnetica]|uniref:L-rhamnose mutarotase n=2 Tax=Williamsia limnetica TaxID=882452 RepID=A0A318RWJ6_WILLI|nr:L-rhamnose mutarotase [Williamsia limnetica]
MHRVCFTMNLRPDRIDDYLAAHQDVWPEMLEALRSTGWHNYSLFLRPTDGLVVGYLETEDFDRARELMAQTEVNGKWQSQMAQYFDTGTHPDTAMTVVDEYFHLA